MNSLRINSFAKLNLTLNITGYSNGYHNLDSVVCSLDMHDLIVMSKRKDKLVSIAMYGCGSENIPHEKNYAVIAAEKFIEKFSTNGADITVYKNIPVAAGLGGSSADSAGVLRGMAKLYGVHDGAGIKFIADECGSDVRYMLTGGYARLYERGNVVEHLDGELKLDMLLLLPRGEVSTPACYKRYDELPPQYGGDSEGAKKAVAAGDLKGLCACVGNALLPAAESLLSGVGECVEELKAFDPLAVNLTGSGCGVYAIFENAAFRDYALSRYRGKARAYPVKAHIKTLRGL